MTLSASAYRATLTVDILAFIVCCAGIVQIAQKPGLGAALKATDNRVYCASVKDPSTQQILRPGDYLPSLAGQDIHHVEDVEFLLDGRRIGDTVACTIERAGTTFPASIVLVHYYSAIYLIIVILVSSLFFFVGVFVSLRRPNDHAARIYHLGSIGTAIMLSTTWGQYATTPAILGIGLRVIFSTMYAVVPVLFFRFTELFPKGKEGKGRSLHHIGLYLLAALLAAGNGVTFVNAVATGRISDFHLCLEVFTVTRWFMVVLVAAGLVMIRRAYFAAGEEPERRKLRWIVWGLFVGFFPFVVLWVIPSLVLSYELIPEEVMLLTSSAIPVAFGISIVKYHIMDIDLLLNRSVVYTVVMAVLVAVYVLIIAGAAAVVTSLTFEMSVMVSAVAAILMALAFEPLRRNVQHVVDRRYFRVRYDYRRVGRELLDQIKQAPSEFTLARQCVERLGTVIPTEKLGFLTARSGAMRLEVLAQSIPPEGTGPHFPSDAGVLWSGERLPLTLDDYIEPGVPCVMADETVFRTWGLALAIPLLAKDARLMGMFLLGPKKAGTRFSSEDIDLLMTVGSNAGMEIERIRLMQQLLLKEEEAGRLKALNNIKSDFVAHVSHDLRTPLTSIKMYAELLGPRVAARDRKSKDYLTVIQGEADRLNRMVTTILDSARIEEGAIRYTMQDADLVSILRSVLRLMEYQLRKEGCDVDVRLPRGKRALMFRGDPDAVSEAVINLLSNAMKYSVRRKSITMRAGRRGETVWCSVRDQGMGISEETMPHLFEKFYRDPTLPRSLQGVGIGLSVVKHIMDAHQGTIEVKSTPGKGSEFILRFPVLPHHAGKGTYEKHSRRRG
jgi:signal transduction histidine kinase